MYVDEITNFFPKLEQTEESLFDMSKRLIGSGYLVAGDFCWVQCTTQMISKTKAIENVEIYTLQTRRKRRQLFCASQSFPFRLFLNAFFALHRFTQSVVYFLISSLSTNPKICVCVTNTRNDKTNATTKIRSVSANVSI